MVPACARFRRLGNSNERQPKRIREGNCFLWDVAPIAAALSAPRLDSLHFPGLDETCFLRSAGPRCPYRGE